MISIWVGNVQFIYDTFPAQVYVLWSESSLFLIWLLIKNTNWNYLWQVTGYWWHVTGNRWQENKIKIDSSRAQFTRKKNFFLAAFLDPLRANVLQSETTSFHDFSKKSNKIGHWPFGRGGKNTFKQSEQLTKIRKKKQPFSISAIWHHFWANFFKSETTSFHYFSPRIQNM